MTDPKLLKGYTVSLSLISYDWLSVFLNS